MHGSVGWDNIKIATVSCDGFKKWIPSLRALVERDSITEKSPTYSVDIFTILIDIYNQVGIWALDDIDEMVRAVWSTGLAAALGKAQMKNAAGEDVRDGRMPLLVMVTSPKDTREGSKVSLTRSH
ncbi:hypothetical protein BDV97DRAFT_371539 [Delphinella strobiligena]|nr:hypothetical protein BDV97DRAFT_371539 [Delphinella strobiligena]